MDSLSNQLNAINEIEYYININRFETAIDKINEYLSIDPSNGYLLYLLAACYFQLDKYEEAFNYCYDSLKVGFPIEGCQTLFGKIYLETKKYKEAEEAFLKVLSINPQNPEVMAMYSYLLIMTGFKKKGDILFKEAMRLEPENETVLQYKSLYLLSTSKKKNKERDEVLRGLVNNSNSEVKKLVHLGLHNYFEYNFKEAKENFRQAYILDPYNKDLLEILNEVNRDAHFFFKPLHWADKIGGPAIIWISFITLFTLFYFLSFTKLAIVTFTIYLIYVVYSWSAFLIYKLFFKRG